MASDPFAPRSEPKQTIWTALAYIIVFWFFADALRFALEAL